MKTIQKIAIASVMFILCAFPALASDDDRGGRGGKASRDRRRKPIRRARENQRVRRLSLSVPVAIR